MNLEVCMRSVLPYESHISIFYKLMRNTYRSRKNILSSSGITNTEHFFPSGIPQWLLGISSDPVQHMPSSYCPRSQIINAADEINYCPQCLADGHHSVFFLLKCTEVCLIHRRKLLQMCRQCRDRFIGNVEMDRYFDCPLEVGIIECICENCNLTWPDLGCYAHIWTDFSVRDEDKIILHLQAEWYEALMKGQSNGSSLCKLYYAHKEYRAKVTIPIEARYCLTSPQRILGELYDKQRVRWIGASIYRNFDDINAVEYHKFRQMAAEACLEIEKKYLSKHGECLRNCNSLSEYMGGVRTRFSLCIPALAYVMLRLKLACAIWPTTTSVSARKSCFDNLLKYLPPDVEFGTLKKCLSFMYLKFMGELQYDTLLGRSFIVLLRSKTIDQDYFHMRTTRYSLRCACQCDFEMEKSFEVTRLVDSGGINVICNYDYSGSLSFLFM